MTPEERAEKCIDVYDGGFSIYNETHQPNVDFAIKVIAAAIREAVDAVRKEDMAVCAAIEKTLRETLNPDTAAGAAQCHAAIRDRLTPATQEPNKA